MTKTATVGCKIHLDRINQLVEIWKQKALVGDGELPLIRNYDGAPLDWKNINEYDQFLKESYRREKDLKSKLSQEEIVIAEELYFTWFKTYLTDDERSE